MVDVRTTIYESSCAIYLRVRRGKRGRAEEEFYIHLPGDSVSIYQLAYLLLPNGTGRVTEQAGE